MAAAKKKANKSAAKAGDTGPAVVDPRESLQPSKAVLDATLAEVEAVLAKLTPPAEPKAGDLVDVMLHILFAESVPCGLGQEALRRIREEFVDRNEYRVTEAFETEEILGDLGIPDLFERCRTAKIAVTDIHNDQNQVTLDFLREAGVAERKGFFTRVPGIAPPLVKFLNQVLGYEEVLFSPRSTQRVQQRLGYEGTAADAFFEKLKTLLAPFGHLPLMVGPDRDDGKPLTEPVLCPLCAVTRLQPK